MSSVEYANKILDEADRKLSKNYSKADFINLVNKVWGVGTNGSQYKFSELAKNGKLSINGEKYTNLAVGIIGAGGNWLIADANDETLDEKIVGAGVDVALIAVGFIPGVGQVLNISLIGASLAGLDILGWIKSLYRGDKIDSLDWIGITKNGFLRVTMPDGTVYMRPASEKLKSLYGISKEPSGMLSGNSKSDVLFGGSGKDIFIGHGGNDLLLGGAGYDTYFTDSKDTIKDSDSKGQVYFHGRKLTDGTQIEKGSNIYKTKDNIKYELIDNKLIVNDSLIIEDFNPYQECLDITLHKVDEIAVNVSNATAVEKAGKMNFTISLGNHTLLRDGSLANNGFEALKEFANLNLLVA